MNAPEGWKKTTLEDYVDIKHGFAFKSEYFTDNGDYILMTPGNFYESGGFRDQGNKTKYYTGEIPDGYILKKGDVLLAMTEQATGLLGSAAYVPEDNKYLHNQRLGLLKIKDTKKACIQYLYLIYNSPFARKQISERSTGTKVKHTSPDMLKGVISLIPSLLEQKKIAQIISTWDKAITTTEQLLANSQQQKKTLMQQLLTGKKRSLGFCGEWRFATFDEAFRVANKKSSQVKSSDYLQSGSIPIVDQGQQMIAGYTNCDDPYSDIPVIVFGDHTRCLKWVDFTFAPGADGTQVLKGTSLILDKFGYYLLTNTEIPNLGYSRHMRELKEKEFKIPLDKKEQQKIASVLSAADREIEILEQKLSCLRQEKKALMQQLLTGKRRVKVDGAEIPEKEAVRA